MELGSDYANLLNWLHFRLVAMVGNWFYYLYYIIDKKAALRLYIPCISMIPGGAISESNWLHFSMGFGWNNAPLMQPSPWFHGQVVRYVLLRYLGGIPSRIGCLLGRAILRFGQYLISRMARYLWSSNYPCPFRICFSREKRPEHKWGIDAGLNWATNKRYTYS